MAPPLSTEAVMRLIAQHVPDAARRAVAVPVKRLGVVDQDELEGIDFASVMVDGDELALSALNMTGSRLRQGDRVMVDFYPPHGVVVSGVLAERSWYSAWGILERRSLTTDYGPFSASNATDLLVNASVLADRSYRVHVETDYTVSIAGSIWTAECWADGDPVGKFFAVNEAYLIGDHGSGCMLYEPDEDGDVELRATFVLAGGAASVTLQGSTDFPRSIWLEDIGPRLS